MTPDGAKALPSCPFCGGKAFEGKLDPVKLRWLFIACSNCHARTAASCSLERVKARWAKRTPDPATVRVLEAAKDVALNGDEGARGRELRKAVEALAGRER